SRTSPGRLPANATIPEPPCGVKYWNATDSPASARLPTSLAPATNFWKPDFSLLASSVSGVVNLVSTPTFAVFHRTFPASQNTVLTAGRALSFSPRSPEIWLRCGRGHRSGAARDRQTPRPPGTGSFDRSAPLQAGRARVGRRRPGRPGQAGGGGGARGGAEAL